MEITEVNIHNELGKYDNGQGEYKTFSYGVSSIIVAIDDQFVIQRGINGVWSIPEPYLVDHYEVEEETQDWFREVHNIDDVLHELNVEKCLSNII